MDYDNERLNLEGRISTIVNGHLINLFDLWQQTGFTREDRHDRIAVVERQVDETLTEMVDEEKKNFDELLKKIEHREREHVALSKELGISINEDSRAIKLATLTILELDKELRDEVVRLKKLKEERMKEVIELKSKDEEICGKVKMEPYFISVKTVPSDEKLEDLKRHIREMTTLRNHRFKHFVELKRQILDLHEELETEPSTSFERIVVCEEDEAFSLSSANMDSVEKMLRDLMNLKETNIVYSNTLREKITVLFDKLEISGKDMFISAHNGFTKMVIEELEFKLRELEALKLQHIEEFIVKIRAELREWWTRCYYGAAQQSQFKPFYSDDYSERLLEEHEKELDKIRKHYNDNSHLFEMVEEVQDIWSVRIDLERRSKDPSRLGNYKLLAQEEKDRKRVNTRLPKLEEKLESAIMQYEYDNGIPFLVGGVPFKEYWAGERKRFDDELLEEKQKKQDFKKQQNMYETIYGSVPASVNKTKINNKRPREEQTPHGKSKLARMERSVTASALSSATKAGGNTLQRTYTTSSLATRSATLSKPMTSRYAASKVAPRRALKDRNDSLITPIIRVPTREVDSLDSNICHDRFHVEAISSTFQVLPEIPRSTARNLFATPSKSTPMKISTPKTVPSTSNFMFRTPTSRALTPVNKNKILTLRNGKKLPFLI